jgi:hypothetical protein
MKKRNLLFVSSFFIVLLIFGLFFLGLNITGNVTQIYSPSEWNESEINRVWNEIFLESSSGTSVFIQGVPLENEWNAYYSYKIQENGLWALVNIERDFYGRIDREIGAYFLNATPEVIDIINNFTEYDDSNVTYLMNLPFQSSLIENRAENLNLSGASEEFFTYFSVDEDCVWVEASGKFECLGEYVSLMESYSISEMLVAYETDQLVFWNYDFHNSSLCEFPVLTQNISNYTFVRNSTWNVVVDLDDYYENSSVFSLEWFEGWTNLSIDGANILKFRPDAGFLGNYTVQVHGRNCTNTQASNLFHIFVVERINIVPKQIKDLENILLAEGGSFELNLDDYFEDDNGDNITYRISSLDNFKESISKNILTVSLESNYTGFERVYIYANDSFSETQSNKFYVSGGAIIPIDDSDESENNDNVNASDLDVNLTENGVSADSSNESGGDASSEEGGSFLWILFIVGGVVLLVGFGFVVFLLSRKKNIPIVEDRGEQKKLAEEYYKKIDLKKT